MSIISKNNVIFAQSSTGNRSFYFSLIELLINMLLCSRTTCIMLLLVFLNTSTCFGFLWIDNSLHLFMLLGGSRIVLRRATTMTSKYRISIVCYCAGTSLHPKLRRLLNRLFPCSNPQRISLNKTFSRPNRHRHLRLIFDSTTTSQLAVSSSNNITNNNLAVCWLNRAIPSCFIRIYFWR